MSECAIVLAGGGSRRMGRSKALLRVGRETLIEWQTRRLLENGVDRVCLVVAEVIRERVERLLKPRRGGTVRIVAQPHPEAPPFDSLRLGLRAVLGRPNLSGIIWVLPVDVPVPSALVFSRLRRVMSRRGVFAAIPTWRRRGGHPVALTARFANRLASLNPLRPESRLDVALHAQRSGTVWRVHAGDPHIHVNLNTPRAWQAFVRRAR